jgi:predicted permease
MTQLEADIRQRQMTDWQTAFWPALLLSIVTCGIYWFYVLYKLLERREQHFERMVSMRSHLIEVLREKAEAAGKLAEVEQDLSQLEGFNLDATSRDRNGEKSPVLWLVLSIVVGIVVYYVYYFLNDDFVAHESNEHDFMLKASEIMNKIGVTQNQIVTSSMVPVRNFVTFLILTIVTCGIYGIYWIYTLITDPNNHFDDHAVWEAQVLALLSA